MSIAAICACGMSSSGICNESIKECMQLIRPIPNTQLPADVDADVLWDENSALIGGDLDDLSFWSGRDVMKKEDFLKAISKYANKLYAAQQEIESLRDRCNKMESLIEDFLHTHENESIIDRDIFNKFQNFMDGAE